MEQLREWWPAILAAFTAVLGFRTGQERNKWRLDQVEKNVDSILLDLKDIKAGQSTEAVSVAVLAASLEEIKATTQYIKTVLDHKQDKLP